LIANAIDIHNLDYWQEGIVRRILWFGEFAVRGDSHVTTDPGTALAEYTSMSGPAVLGSLYGLIEARIIMFDKGRCRRSASFLVIFPGSLTVKVNGTDAV